MAAIVIIWQGFKDLTPKENVRIEINYSEISNDYDLQNLTYKAVDYQGNEIFGESYYGVDGTYTKEKPLIKGESYYTYWVKNDSYYIEPGELVIDKTHRNQSIITKAYKKVNLSDDIRVIDTYNYYPYNEIGFRRIELQDVAEFEVRYYSEKRTRFPFRAVIIFEYDKQFDLGCDLVRVRVPDFYYISSVNNTVDAFGLEEDIGDWEIMKSRCFVEKYLEKELINNKIKITVVPNDFLLIDWATASMQSFYFDLATCAMFFYYNHKNLTEKLLYDYFGRAPKEQEVEKFVLMQRYTYIHFGFMFLYLGVKDLPNYGEMMQKIGDGSLDLSDPMTQQMYGFSCFAASLTPKY